MKKLTFEQQVLTGFAATAICGIILAVTSFFSIEKLQADAEWVSHSEKVVNSAKEVQYRMLEAESAARGYTASGSSIYLDAFNQSAAMVNPEIQTLKILTLDDIQYQRKLHQLTQDVSVRLRRLREIIRIRDRRGGEEAARMLTSEIVLEERANVYNTITGIIYFESNLLAQRKQKTGGNIKQAIIVIIVGSFAVFALLALLFSYIKKTFTRQKLIEERVRQTNSQLKKITMESEDRNWQLSGTSILNKAMRNEPDLMPLTSSVITSLAKYLNAQIGALYLYNEADSVLEMAASYAYGSENLKKIFKLGEGLAGQAAAERQRIVYNNVPDDYIKISSALGECIPKTIVVQPFVFDENLKGVIELGFSEYTDEKTLEFIRRAVVSIGIAVNTAQDRIKMLELYEQTQSQAEELESQAEELMVTNEELLRKAHLLQSSEEELQVQQEELRLINSELEEKAEQLEERNKVIEVANEAISQKAKQLEDSNKYKSDFLANMSHELRTPLNSILILARILQENKNGNLSEDQIKYAGVIKNAGSDLLDLINDILDLSKIEAGKIDLVFEHIKVDNILDNMNLLFKEVAFGKKINFEVSLENGLPETITSDKFRIEQILKNLLSNAFKFTSEGGSVVLKICKAENGEPFTSQQLQQCVLREKPVIAFKVQDTGIGIPEDKQQLIFDAFLQADSSTSRKYGGTGLGLSICRKLSEILGGEIKLESKPCEGSAFTLFLPAVMENQPVIAETVRQKSTVRGGKDKKTAKVKKEDQVILIIEDDVNFAEVLKDYAVENGFKPLLAYQGDIGLKMAVEQLPDAIILDIMLPGMDGWQVLKKIKEDNRTCSIPVHMMSAGDDKQQQAVQFGASGFIKKPVNRDILDNVFKLLFHSAEQQLEKVLIIEDQEIQNNALRSQLLKRNVQVEQAFSGEDALNILLKNKNFDCIILDINLPDMSGLELLDQIKAQPGLSSIPVVVNTAMELDEEKMERVRKHTLAMVLKSDKSNERLQDEITLFFNKVKSGSLKPFVHDENSNNNNPINVEKALENKSVLITDDDMRNIYALTSAIEPYGLHIDIAMNGQQALNKLNEKPDFDLVLMDIMMPEMDGYEAMAAIRKQKRFAKLPIIALTAKAMKNDREKCIEAGASDYISKPLDMDKLLSLIRVWVS